ncbi:TIGR04222 domain-containing membrane protein [Actinacidiphila glaucinigra]|uniref:TIGR04222 domain-containing membrane protein n=1 Tax=Actinacidiphila glaucinigra TaxID=235986 RepID=UPI0033DABCD3
MNPGREGFDHPRRWARTRQGTGGEDMDEATAVRLEPHEIAMLRGGPRAALTVAVVALHLRGAVESGRPGTLRREPSPEQADPPPHRHPLEKAVRVGLYRPAGIRELLGRAVVRRALSRMRAELAGAGLLRLVRASPTRAARRYVADLRRNTPMPEHRAGLAEEDILLAVALHGDPALTALVPAFTAEAGLTGRGAAADEGLFPFGRHEFLRWRADYPEDGPGYGSDGGAGHGGHGADHSADHSGGGFGCGGGGGGGGGGSD